METKSINPQNFEEKLVWYSITGTYVFYLFGALVVVAPVIAWVLFFYGLKKLAMEYIEGDEYASFGVPLSVLIWFLGMFMMLVALILGHINHGIGLGGIIKSIIGWAKGWALLAIFPFIGCLDIRPALIYRAACVVCFHTLLLLPLFIGAAVVGLPQSIYVSPLKVLGPGPEFYSLNLYEIDPEGAPRWRFFTPWAPAIGFVANIYFIFAMMEKEWKWKLAGISGCLVMILLSKSRLALVAIVTVWGITWFLSNFRKPFVLYLCGLGSALIGCVALPIAAAMEQAMATFKAARADSSRVRSALGRIAVDRWSREAPIFGHGVVERGPHLVEYMPIGSHHSWFGLLFVKGIVGFISLAVPMIVSFLTLWYRSHDHEPAKVGIAVLMILFLYTFGENLEILAYLVWPGLLFLGMGVNARCQRSHDL